jgi:hypothetical protein
MNQEQVYNYLCYYDPRNGYFSVLGLEDDLESRKPREKGCSCDNCFYGRDMLAMEILRLQPLKILRK